MSKKLISVLLIITVVFTFSLIKVEEAHAGAGDILKVVMWIGKIIIAIVVFIVGIFVSEKISEAGQQTQALEYMCNNPCDWKERHPEWDIFEREWQELVMQGKCRACEK